MTDTPAVDDESGEILAEFLVESFEGMAQLDLDLVELERDPGDEERLRAVFRTVHSIKGSSGFLGFSQLQSVAHAGEGLLSKLRDATIRLDEEITTALLSMVDAIKAILTHLEGDGTEGERDDAAVIAELIRLSSGERREDAAEARPFGEILVETGGTTSEAVAEAVAAQQAGDPRHLGEILVERGAIEPKDVVKTLAIQRAEKKATLSEANVRVDVALLDEMMDLVGELVLARNQILQHVSTQADSPITAPTQRLNLITSELQERVMKTRMQPIGTVWAQFPRTVRDLALACGKQVRLDMDGQDTEVDRTIIEALRDPFTHLVRNAVDHGIEAAEARVAAGKPAQGRLLLRAFHEGGRVNIEIIDDGGGIDLDKVRASAIDKRLATAEQAASMIDREVIDLLFLPGLSTAPTVTNVSGRGVGMDVVKTNIEKIGGVIDIATSPGAGTTVTIRIPLTLAIIPALIVTSAGQRYAVPQVSLLELVRLDEGAANHIEYVGGSPVYRLRGRLLALLDLAEQLGTARTGSAPETTTIVVLQADGQSFGLIVDDVHDTEEIVVKPLGDQLKGIQALSGVTIMGDGRVAVILDVAGLARRAGLIGSNGDQLVALEGEHSDAAGEVSGEALLLVRVGATQLAMPQARVDRLEEIEAGALERAGDHDAVQYRGSIMPVLRLDQVVGRAAGDAPDAGHLQMIVVSCADERPMGIVVDSVVDIVEEQTQLDTDTARSGTLGSLVVAGHITDLIDIDALALGLGRARQPGGETARRAA